VARVLIIDDEPLLAEVLRRALADEFDVTATTRVSQALQGLIAGDHYDLILCDVMMPGTNGVELRDRVHEVHPELAARIVFMTGGVPRDDIRERLESLPNLVLEKPIALGLLRDLVSARVRCDATRRVALPF